MDAFVKSFATYRTIKQAPVLSSSLIVDSLDDETSVATVAGTTIARSDTGNWLVVDGQIYYISKVKPQTDRTSLTLVSPLNAFDHPLELGMQQPEQTIGGFVSGCLNANWVNCDDPTYAMRYLVVYNRDISPYIAPELDSNGCFNLPEYCRLMRKSYRTVARFSDAGSALACTISTTPITARQVSFEDGKSQLQSVDYSASGTAKLTVLQDVDTGQKDAQGNKILHRNRTNWYLAEDGTVTQSIPARRAPGKWATISVKESENVEAKVVEAFAKNKKNHKLEFWSTLDLAVQDDCTFFVYGELLRSYISYKQKISTDKRYYYKSGELATTATEKLRGATK